VTQDANLIDKLSPAVIVTVGPDAGTVGELLAARYPIDSYSLSAEQLGSTDSEFDGLIEKVNSSARHTDAVTELPAVVVIADVGNAEVVLRVLDAVRGGETTVKPRVWPAFVAGTPSHLAEFDRALDERGTGSCDLVLIMTGATSPDASADALAAWLHVKIPAPASVLAELPDSEGRICRYVALGCRAVHAGGQAQADASPDLVAISIDSSAVAARVSAELSTRAHTDPLVETANEAVAALTNAAQQYSAPDLLRCESELAVALTEVDRKLVPVLRAELPKLVVEMVAQVSAAPPAGPDSGGSGPDPAADSATDSAAHTLPEAAAEAGAPGRTHTVSQLVLLASKGGLTKMFSRNRMATVAETIGLLAEADVAATVRSAVSAIDGEVPSLVSVEAQRISAEQLAEGQAVALAAQEAESTTWNQNVDQARRDVELWPTVDVTGISRSWGGGVPPARQYVVGSASALRLLTEDDAFMPIVDLRTQPRSEADGDEIDLRDGTHQSAGRATVLLAQYGLPLAALR